jgi:hypothetical protein
MFGARETRNISMDAVMLATSFRVSLSSQVSRLFCSFLKQRKFFPVPLNICACSHKKQFKLLELDELLLHLRVL